MAGSLIHPILVQSFAAIDREMGAHSFTEAEYAVVRRVIHATADFEFKELIRFTPGAIEGAISLLQQKTPIVTDVSMVKQGVITLASKTFGNSVISAVEQAPQADLGKTRTETGLLKCYHDYPEAIYAIGNAPTALLALCESLKSVAVKPGLVIGVPVGFISVVESKQVLAQTPVPQIRVEGRKGGSAVAAAILNALMVLAWEQQVPKVNNTL